MNYFNQWIKEKHGYAYMYVINIKRDNYFLGFIINSKRNNLVLSSRFNPPENWFSIVKYDFEKPNIKNLERKMIKVLFL